MEKSEAAVAGDPDTRILREASEIAAFMGRRPTSVGVAIHVIGEPGKGEIVVQPSPAVARRNLDHVHWIPGANCGAWEVRFKKDSPLDPPGPYGSDRKRPVGGRAVGESDVHRYDVRAVDLRDPDGGWISIDPDVVIEPSSTR